MPGEPLPESSVTERDLNGDKAPLMKKAGGCGGDQKGKRMRCFAQEEGEDNDNHPQRRRKYKMVLEAAPPSTSTSSSNEPFNDNRATTSEPVLKTTTPVQSNPPPLQLVEEENGLYKEEPTMPGSTDFALDDYFSVDEFMGPDYWELDQFMLEEEEKNLEQEPVQGQPAAAADHQCSSTKLSNDQQY